MEQAKILIQFPTMGREKKFKQALKAYLKFMDDKDNFLIRVITEANDPVMLDDKMIDWIYDQSENIVIHFGHHVDKIDAVNSGIRDAVFEIKWDICLLASDDMIPEVQGYDNIIRKLFAEHHPDFDGVIHFNDGHQGANLNTLSILGKKYFDRFGYIYHPDYKSFYADNEFHDVSMRLEKHIYWDQVIIRHKHPDLDRSLYDDTYMANNQWLDHDFKVYNRRRMNNFGLSENK
jgi:hypothetical protein